MSNSTASAHPTATPIVKKQRKPEPARVVQSFHHEVQTRGKRGALRRTGELYNISDESVRRYVAADEQRGQLPVLPDQLAYTPAPGEASYLAERERIAAQLVAQQHKALTPAQPLAPAIRHKPRPHCHRLRHGTHTHLCGIITSSYTTFERKPVANDAITPQAPHVTRHSAERAQNGLGQPQTPQLTAPHTSGTAAPAVKRYAPRPIPRSSRAGIIEWVTHTLFTPGPALAVLVFLVLWWLITR